MGYRLSKIYTRTGDDGTTTLDGKQRLPKDALRIEALGTLDELNCALGLTITQSGNLSVNKRLAQTQNELFDLGSELCPPHHVNITDNQVMQLEYALDQWNATLPPLKEFLLPGGNPAAASCHLARAICRRAERCLVALHTEEPLNPAILRYINRLSDLLFVAARILSRDTAALEELWTH